MKKFLLLLILLTAGDFTGIYAFKTFTEKVNPFNKFLNPTDGVDLYSGTAAFTKNLYTMQGRNGLDIGINLKYSSNVYMSVRSRNDKNPTSWVGLGWNLSYGSVRSDHKGTANPADDDFYWESPEGYSKKILVEFELGMDLKPTGNNIKAQIEDMPYVKVVPVLNASKWIEGWQIKKIDGTLLSYGDLSFSDNRNATRNTFAYGNYIEPVINVANTYLLYPYQWDLADISDNFGNHIVFKYWQDVEKIGATKWGTDVTDSTVNSYTKASYIRTIIGPDGKRIEFEIGNKNTNEYYDPYTFSVEPDAFIEKFERYTLNSITLKNSKNDTLKRFNFLYGEILNQQVSTTLPAYFEKRLLTKIEETNKTGEQYNIDVFTYYNPHSSPFIRNLFIIILFSFFWGMFFHILFSCCILIAALDHFIYYFIHLFSVFNPFFI